MRIAFHTFGCKLNQYETESLVNAFAAPFFSIVSDSDEADLYVVNSCAVTSKSEQKVRVFVRSLSKSHPNALIIATGCYAQVDGSALETLGDNVVVVPQAQKDSLHDLAKILPGLPLQKPFEEGATRMVLKGFVEGLAECTNDPFRYDLSHFTYHSRAFLKIQDGCDYRCSYCLIPHARGPSVSLGVEKAAARAGVLEGAGYREIVLTGVNIASFRHGDAGLAELVEALLEATTQCRFRLSSLEPETVDRAILRVIAHERVCPHFHLPVQSGSDRILRVMNRRYTRARVLDAVEKIRGVKPDAFIAGDFIVGFPGEDAEDFAATVDLIEKIHLANLHVFPFSIRPNTTASELEGRVNDRIKKNRVRELLILSDRLLASYTHIWEGRLIRAIVEGSITDDGRARGISENYLKLLVYDLPVSEFRPGMLVRCRLVKPGNPSTARFLRILA